MVISSRDDFQLVMESGNFFFVILRSAKESFIPK